MNRFSLRRLVFFSVFSILTGSSLTLSAAPSEKKKKSDEIGYTINFENVSIKEFLKFVSKIGNMNVIYNDADLNFNVTIVSEEETNLENVMSALVQILRIHNLTLIEEDQNLLIHNNSDVRQIPTVVSAEFPLGNRSRPAIMTKVFKIQKGNPANIASLITPMLSKDAIVEVSMETRQLIITDVTSSIETVQELLLSLDAPETPYDVDLYESRFVSVAELALLAKQILKPISDNTTLELIPQVGTGTLYIISTPFMIEKTLAVLKDLDRETALLDEQKKLASENVFIYKLKFKSAKDVKSILLNVSKEAQETGFRSPALDATIKNAKYIESARSLMFIGPSADLSIIQSLLSGVDTPAGPDSGMENSAFYLYDPGQLDLPTAMQILKEISTHLKNTDYANPGLVNAINNAQQIDAINSILFTGDPGVINEIKTLTASVGSFYDQDSKLGGGSQFLIYNIKLANEEQIRQSLLNLADHLKKSQFPNKNLISAIESIRWIKATNSLMFVGHADALQELQGILPSFDISPAASKSHLSQVPLSTDFIVYSPKQTSIDVIVNKIELTIKNLKSADLADPAFLKCLESMRELPSANQLIFTGDQQSLQRLSLLLKELDTNHGSNGVAGSDVVFVPVVNKDASYIVKILNDTGEKLAKDPTASPALVNTLKSAVAMKESNSVMLTGTATSIAKAEELAKMSDTKGALVAGTEVWLYPLKNLSTDELKSSLLEIAQHAHSQHPSEGTLELVTAIQSIRQVPDSRTVQFVGSPATIEKLKELITILESQAKVSGVDLGSNFLVYKVKNSNPQELLNHIRQLVKDSPFTANDPGLIKTIRGARYVKESSSLVFTGSRDDLSKLKDLLEKLDVGQMPAQTASDRSVEGYKLYKPIYVPGPELIQMVKNFEEHLVASGVTNGGLSEVIDHLAFVNRTNTLIVTGDAQPVAEVMALLEKFDTRDAASGGNQLGQGEIETIDETGFLIYKLQHQDGEGIVDALALVSKDLSSMKNSNKNADLIESIRSVQWISITNSLLATGEPKVLTKLKELIESIDRPLKQVFIEVLVIEATESDSIEFGLEWGSQGSDQNRIGWGLGNFNPTSDGGGFPTNYNKITGSNVPSGQDIPPIPGGFLGVIGDIVWHKGKSYAALGSLLTALKASGDTTVVLSQKIVAQDNQNARIFSGDNVPFTGSLVTTSGLSQTTNANLEYRNIGVTLSITPIIGDNGTVTLDIDEEISEEANQGDSSSDNTPSSRNVNGIRTSKTSMKTRVHMPDKHFLILSGTMRNTTTRSVSGIPCLGGLPMIGAAFSDTKKTIVNRNVIVFVKPHIIQDPRTYSAITRNQEELYGSKKQANQEDFNAGLELVRSPDDEDNYEDE